MNSQFASPLRHLELQGGRPWPQLALLGCVVFLAALARPAAGALIQIPLTAVEVFNAADGAANNRGDQGAAIDGDINTSSYMTPSGTTSPQIAAYELDGGPRLINSVRVAKIGDVDGIGGTIDNMDLEILYTTDSGPLNTRVYQRITGLRNGYNGAELLQANSVNSDGTIDNDRHDYATHGAYSLTFDAANATAIAIRFARDPGDPFAFTHYPTYEFEAFNDAEFNDVEITITTQPQSVSAQEFSGATFNVAATAPGVPPSAFGYQWRRDGADILGATSPTYDIPSVTRDDQGARFTVVVSVGTSSRTSAEAVLTVNALDVTPPAVLRAASTENASIAVCFSEPLNELSATESRNYTLAGGAQVTGARLLEGATVLLAVSGLTGDEFTLTIGGVTDRGGNAVAAGTMVTGPILGFFAADIFPETNPNGVPGAVLSCEEGTLRVLASGHDIWTAEDGFHFLWREVSGDFDVRVQVSSLQGGDFFAKAGLMMREHQGAGSREMSIVVYPSRGIWAPIIRASELGPSDVWGPLPAFPSGAGYPDIWCRLRRTGNTVRCYGGIDGLYWNLISETTPDAAYPDTVLVGLATTAQNTRPDGAVIAEYRNYGTTPQAAPRIVQAPVGATKLVGAAHTFSVAVQGSDPFSYQWQKDTSDIPGATSPTLELIDLQPSHGGSYRVIVSNAAGSVTSAAATLTVEGVAFRSQRLALGGIAVFDAQTSALNNRGDQGAAIDGDVNTFSYLTPSGTVTPQIVAVDLGSSKRVNRLRVAKIGDVDGVAGTIDSMDLEILYATGAGPLNTRQFQRIRGLVNGFFGDEMITAAAVDLNGTVDNDRHDYGGNGYFSLRFNDVQATAIAIRIARDPGDPFNFTHYPTREIELYYDEPTADQLHPVTEVRSFSAMANESTRGDIANAFDGDINTSSYVTAGGTAAPQTIFIDLGGVRAINRFRVAKVGDSDGVGGTIDLFDLELLYTTDTGDVQNRSFSRVNNLQNGYNGAEFMTATAVNPDGTIDDEQHDYATSGYYSLTFGTVNATALALRVSRDPADSAAFVHYLCHELEVWLEETKAPIIALRVFGDARVDSTRDNAANAIDGDLGTSTYLTRSFTQVSQYMVFDLGQLRTVNRLRIAKERDVDGLPGLDRMNLQVVYSSDEGDLSTRNYTLVSAVGSGYFGAELIVADGVTPDGMVVNDVHDYPVHGIYSLTFGAVNATAIGLLVSRNSADPNPFIHYLVREVEVLDSAVSANDTIALVVQRSDNDVVLRWPATPAGFTVESSDRLPAVLWSRVPGTPSVEGAHYVLTIPPDAAARFYRLHR